MENDQKKATLAADNIKKSFKQRDVVKGVSFKVKSGEIVGLLGPNGAGKTTSFYMVVGLLFPDSGRVLIDDENITALPMYVRAKRGVSYLPQNSSIFKKMTVEDNLLSIMEVCGIESLQRKIQLEDLLEKFQIKHIAKSMGSALSGGERRRVEIARALIIKPRFLLLDEPFAGIDPVTVHEIQGIIKALSQEGLGVLITDHNVRETLGTCNRAYVLADGKILTSGKPDEVSNNEAVRENYLGKHFRM